MVTNPLYSNYILIIFPLDSQKKTHTHTQIRFNPHDWLMIWGYTIQQIKGIQRIFPFLF